MIPGELINHFAKIFIQEKALNSKVAQRVLSNFPQHQVEVVTQEPMADFRGTLSASEFDQSKKLLLIKNFEGQFFKRCPGATQKKTLTCCNYHVLNLGQQCNMNCSYCYLQSYINRPMMHMYANIDQALGELKLMAEDHGHLPFRVGTGEVIDSLSLDEISLYSRDLISFFKNYPKWILEFKTKSDKVDQFLDCEHAGNVIVSWSVNSDFISRTEEHGTASLGQRLQAARKVRDRGFLLAFHIDPLIFYPEWKQGYADLVDQITANFLPEDLHTMSMGALRFQPEQRHMMRERFGMNSWVTRAEMFPSEGAKLRYDQNIRNEMFKFILDRFKAHSSRWRIFMCMETPESWISTYANTPMQVGELKDLFRPLPKLPDFDASTVKG